MGIRQKVWDILYDLTYPLGWLLESILGRKGQKIAFWCWNEIRRGILGNEKGIR